MLDLKIIFALLSIVVGVSAFIFYIKDIFLKRTQPHIYTWFIWIITQGTAVAGLWHGKGGPGAWELTLGWVLVIFVFVLSIKYGTKNITAFDTYLLIASLIAILIWWQLHNLVFAVIMVSAIDACIYLPTFRKLWHEPWSETLLSWVFFTFGNILAVLALDQYNFLTLTYLLTIIVFNFTISLLCILRRRKIMKLSHISK